MGKVSLLHQRPIPPPAWLCLLLHLHSPPFPESFPVSRQICSSINNSNFSGYYQFLCSTLNLWKEFSIQPVSNSLFTLCTSQLRSAFLLQHKGKCSCLGQYLPRCCQIFWPFLCSHCTELLSSTHLCCSASWNILLAWLLRHHSLLGSLPSHSSLLFVFFPYFSKSVDPQIIRVIEDLVLCSPLSTPEL